MIKKYIFGIDLGGTAIKFGFFDEKCRLLKKWSIATDKTNNGENILHDISKETEKCISEYKIKTENIVGTGISVPGPVDDTGLVRGCVNIGWGYKKAGEELEKLTGIKTFVLNDANAAGMGEVINGCGGKYKRAVMITIGTGIGGAVIENGNVVSGNRGNAGEIGHFKMSTPDGSKLLDMEYFASAVGIVRFVNEKRKDYPTSPINKIKNIEVRDIANFAKEGDELSLLAFDMAGKYIGLGLSYIAGTVDPEIFIIGGGVSLAGEIIIEPIKKYFSQYAFNTEKEIPFAAASLGNDAGIYGAAEFVTANIKEEQL